MKSITLFILISTITFTLNSQDINGIWSLKDELHIEVYKIQDEVTIKINHDVLDTFRLRNKSLYQSVTHEDLFLEILADDSLAIFNMSSEMMNILTREKDAIYESITIEEKHDDIAIENESVVVTQENIHYDDIAVTYSIGDMVYWTEKETYRTGSSGSALGDMFLGDMYNSTYVIEFSGVVESLIGDKLKVIIQDVGMDNPKWASYNYNQSKSDVYAQALTKVGQTRVLDQSEVEPFN